MAKDKEYMKRYKEAYKQKAKSVTVILPLPMYEELEQLAMLEKTKVSTLLRTMAFAYIHQKTVIPKGIENALREHTLLVRSIANNINQMAHHSNTVKYMTDRDEHNLLMELKRLEDTIKNFTQQQIVK